MGDSRAVKLVWTGRELEFSGSGLIPVTPEVRIDGDSTRAPSPMQMLLLAAASCSASDVVLILKKMHRAPERLEVQAKGVRRGRDPRRFTSVELIFEAGGGAVDEDHLARAVELSVEKYCSVIHTLAADLRVTYQFRVV